VAPSAHQVEREPAAIRREAEERAQAPLGVAGEDVDATVSLAGPSQPAERHREPDQPLLARAPVLLDLGELALELRRDLPVIRDLDPPAVPPHAGDRLADLPDRPPLEAEGPRIHHRLVSDPEH